MLDHTKNDFWMAKRQVSLKSKLNFKQFQSIAFESGRLRQSSNLTHGSVIKLHHAKRGEMIDQNHSLQPTTDFL